MRARKSIAEGPLADRAAGHRPDRSPRPVTRWALASLAPEIEAEIAEIAAACGCELLHAEWKGGVLRLILDRPVPLPEPAAADSADVAETAPIAHSAHSAGGVTLADCEHVAKQASALLDVLDFGNGRYLLEVSSPGLDRQLYRPSDYQRFLGRLARVTYEASGAAEAGTAGVAPGAAGVAPGAGVAGVAGGSRRRTVVARLAEFHAPSAAPGAPVSKGTLTLVDDRSGERLELKLEDIRQARLEIEL
jgi:ribosome maturation factor RimP